MICPYCQQEMEEGWLVYKDTLIWSKRKKAIGVIPIGKDTLYFAPEDSSIFSSHRKAYHCRCCKKSS